MRAKLLSWWRTIRKNRIAAVTVALMGLFALIICIGYWLRWGWTGFLNRTLWDWLNLLGVLAIPVAVALGTAWFTTKQGQVSDAENKDNQHETALQAYIDKMSELLLTNHLRDSTDDMEVRKLARVRTLTVLRRLDGERRASVLQFLQEAGLITKDKRIVDLTGANLTGAWLIRADLSAANLSAAKLTAADLSGADLSAADLSAAWMNAVWLTGANLTGANLTGAYLMEANLTGANLTGANLSAAYLMEANLSAANLTGANLTGAYLTGAYLKYANLSAANLSAAKLSGANLSGADLTGANLTGAKVNSQQLNAARSLKDTIMRDGSKHQ